MDNLIAILKNLGAARIALLVISSIMLVVLVSMLGIRANTKDMTLLYGGLEEASAAKIVESLQTSGVKYEIRGSSVYVPSDKVQSLRLQIAGKGLVGASSQGYELFDKGSTFGTTSLVQNINARRALEGELSRTITSLPSVQGARVHLVMPKKRLFSKEQVEPKASVTLNLGSRILNDDNIQSITHLVAAAVPNLSPTNVTVVDNRGNMLSTGNKSQSNMVNMQSKIRSQIERQYEASIKRMLENVVGANKANVKVTAEMDFDIVEEKSELFDPESAVIRSEQRGEEKSNSSSQAGGGAVGASANIPGQEVGGAGGNGSSSNRQNATETVNYEISKTIRSKIHQGGSVTRLSVAVLVEGRYSDVNGTPEYVAYGEAEKEKFSRLVKSAIGYNEDRGDSVEIIDMAFAKSDEEELYDEPMFNKNDYFKLGEYGLIIAGIFLLIFVILKPLLNASLPTRNSDAAVDAAIGGTGAVLQTDSGEIVQPIVTDNGQIIIPEGARIVQSQAEPETVANEGAMIDLDSVEGKVRESAVKKVIEIMDAQPDESINVIRSWLGGDVESSTEEEK